LRSHKTSSLFVGATAVVSVSVGLYTQRWGLALGLWLAIYFLGFLVVAVADYVSNRIGAGPSHRTRQRILAFLAAHPTWNLRVYSTPCGMRLLATHQLFEPSDREVKQLFDAVRADPVYVRMCVDQRCFRARLTAKPWRIGIHQHMRPRPGVWPVDPARVGLREQWVAHYEERAQGYAACRFVESLGSGVVHSELVQVIQLHDDQSRALSSLPLA
jgi:hypothetical protein